MELEFGKVCACVCVCVCVCVCMCVCVCVCVHSCMCRSLSNAGPDFPEAWGASLLAGEVEVEVEVA